MRDLPINQVTPVHSSITNDAPINRGQGAWRFINLDDVPVLIGAGSAVIRRRSDTSSQAIIIPWVPASVTPMNPAIFPPGTPGFD